GAPPGREPGRGPAGLRTRRGGKARIRGSASQPGRPVDGIGRLGRGAVLAHPGAGARPGLRPRAGVDRAAVAVNRYTYTTSLFDTRIEMQTTKSPSIVIERR